jgi:hypothetical protein
MKRALIVVMMLAGFAGIAADLDIRHYYITNNVSSPLSEAVNQYAYTGESVRFDLWTKRGAAPVELSGTNMLALWELAPVGQPNSMIITGSVSNATNGYSVFSSVPITLTNAVLDSRVKLYQEIAGTNKYIGVLYAAKMYLLSVSSSVNTNYVGPFPDNL